MEWNLLNFFLATLFVSLGALLQAVTGLGAGLIIVPLLALISVELIPGPMIFGSVILSALMAFFGRKNIDFSNIVVVLSGVLVGTIAAASFISMLTLDKLGLVFGLFILFAVLMSVHNPRFSLSSKGFATAGALSGFMGTSAGVGAPVLAMLYQNHTGSSIRATLAFLYLISSIMMMLFLSFAGRFGESEIVSGLFLMPGFVLGYFVSLKLVKFFDKTYARIAVLGLSSLSAGLLIWRSI